MIHIQTQTGINKAGINNLLDTYLHFYKRKPNDSTHILAEKNIIENNNRIYISGINKEKCIGYIKSFFSFSTLSFKRKLILEEIFIHESKSTGFFATKLIKAVSMFAAAAGITSISIE